MPDCNYNTRTHNIDIHYLDQGQENPAGSEVDGSDDLLEVHEAEDDGDDGEPAREEPIADGVVMAGIQQGQLDTHSVPINHRSWM